MKFFALLAALLVVALGEGKSRDKDRDKDKDDYYYRYVYKMLYYCSEYYYYADTSKMRPMGIKYDRDYKYIDGWYNGNDDRHEYYDWVGSMKVYDYDYNYHGYAAWLWYSLYLDDYKDDDRDRDRDRDRKEDKEHYPGYVKYTIHYDYYKDRDYEYYPGQITVEGIWKDEYSMIPIVGGSGYYKGAIGWMNLIPYYKEDRDRNDDDGDRRKDHEYIWKIYAYICYVYDYYEYDYKDYIKSRYFEDYECNRDYCSYGHYYKY